MPGANGDRKGVRFAVQDGLEDENGDDHARHRRSPPPTLGAAHHRSPHEDGSDDGPSSRRNSSRAEGEGRRQSKKRPRPERNVDEIDDVDDWRPEDDDDDNDGGGGFLSEKALLEAKRARRLRRARGGSFDDDDDNDAKENGAAQHGDGHREANRWDRTVGASLLDADGDDDNDGIPITPFNMDQEENDGDGYFDGDTYVFRHKRGDDEEPDAWADASDEEFNEASAAVPRTRGGLLAPTKAVANDNGAQSGPNFDEWTERELYARIVPLVSDTETVTAAIVRYGGLIRHHTKSTNGDSSLTTPASARAQEALNELTEASSALLLKGHVDIYQKTRADLLKLLPESATERQEESADLRRDDQLPKRKKVVQWEYMGNEDKQIHGPYTTEQMRQWTSAGYFVGASAVQIRPIYVQERAEQDVTLQDDLMNDLMEDDDGEDYGHENDADNTEKSASKEQVRGEWQLSDQVDFGLFD